MVTATIGFLLRQHDMAWKLMHYHLDTLTTEECLWRPALVGPHVHKDSDGSWRADWPEHERYDLGPASIAWLTWHLDFWSSMVLNHSIGDATLTREQVLWAGDAESVRARLGVFETKWRQLIERLTDEDLQSAERTRWPFRDRPFGDVVAWVNIELTKNGAEIGYARFLYGVERLRRPV